MSQRVSQKSVELLFIPLLVVWKFCSVRFGSQPAQDITDHGQVMNMVTNLRYNVADKIGSITGLG